MPNEIYHRSDWGESKAEDFGDVYYDHAATNKLYNHSDYYENSDGTDATLKDLNNKASIVLTPTAYTDGSLNTVIPPYGFGSELIVNGDFASGTSPFEAYQCTLSNVNNTLVATATSANDSRVKQVMTTVTGKKYKITADLLSLSGSKVGVTDRNFGSFSYSGDNDERTTSGQFVLFFTAQSTTTSVVFKMFDASIGESFSIDNVSVKEIEEADFDFSRGSSATRVNEQGLVEDVQILSGELVQNGNFEQIGSELVTNGDFSDGSTGWTHNNLSGTSTFSVSNNELTFTRDTFGDSFYQTDVAPAVAGVYLLTFNITAISGGSLRYSFSPNSAANTSNRVSANSVGSYSTYFVSDGTLLDFVFDLDSNGASVTIDNVSVKEVGQNWTFGTGWSMGDGKVIADGTMTASDTLNQSYNFTDGNKYRFQFTVSDYQSGSVYIREPFDGLSDAVSANGTFTFDYIVGTANEIRFRSNDGFTGSLDNVSFKEVTDDTDLPRIDFTDGTGSLLLEPQRTNTFVYSEDYSQSNWIKNQITATANSIVSPDGSLNASLITISSSTPYLGQSQSLTSSTNYTMSAFVKKGTNRWVRLAYVSSSANAAWFDLENNVVGSQSGYSVSASIENYGNGWYRITNTFTSHTSSGNAFLGLSDADNSTSASSSIGNTVYVWGLQVTQGDYATSYIPTSGSTVTRSADVANNSGNADLINSTEGVLYFEFKPNSTDTSSLNLSDGSSNNFLQIYIPHNTTNLRYRLTSNGVSQFDRNLSTSTDLSLNNKYAFKWKLNDYSLWVNGSELDTHLTGSTPIGMNSINFYSVFSSLQKVNGKVKCVAVFKEALSNDLLERLTGEGYESFRLLAEANNYTII